MLNSKKQEGFVVRAGGNSAPARGGFCAARQAVESGTTGVSGNARPRTTEEVLVGSRRA